MIGSENRKLPKTARLAHAVDEQRTWIRKCGGDLPGYIQNYVLSERGQRLGRTVEYAERIYEADLAELSKAEQRLADAKKRSRR